MYGSEHTLGDRGKNKGFYLMLPGMITLLKEQEGFSALPYHDSRGVLSIGFGTNLNQGITRVQASAMLFDQLAKNHESLIGLPWFLALDETRQSVIENMSYNLGVSGMLGFRDMIVAITESDWAGAAAQMLASEWAAQVGDRARKLAQIMLTGKIPNVPG